MSRKSVSRKSVARKSVSRKSVSRKSVSRKSMSRKSLSKGHSGKGGKGGGGADDEPAPWISEIDSIYVNDEEWECHLTVVQEENANLTGLIDLANQQSRDGNRWPVRVISMDYIKEKVLNHCEKTHEQTAYSALCEAIKQQAGKNFDQPISSDLLVYFIKYEMLEFREADMDKKAEEERILQEVHDNEMKLDLAMGRRPKDYQKRGSRRQSSKGDGRRQSSKGGGRRQSSKGGGRRQSSKAGGRRQSAKRGSTKRGSTKRGSTKRGSTKRGSTKRGSTKRGSTKRGSTKRGSTKRGSTKRGSTRRQSSRKGSMKRGSKLVGEKKSRAQEKSALFHAMWKKKKQGIKFDTKLNTRDMPRKDIKYVEDFPVKGPQAYFIITQIKNIDLPKSIKDHNLPLNAVVKYTDPKLEVDNKKDQYIELMEEVTKDFLYRKSDKRQLFDFLKDFNSIKDKLKTFWHEFLPQTIDPVTKKAFEDTILTTFSPDLNKINPESLTKKTEMKESLYEELCMLTYFLGKVAKLHERYTASVKVYDVAATYLTQPDDLILYTSVMNSIPNEICDVPMVVDMLTTQACHNLRDDFGYDFASYGWLPEPRIMEVPLTQFQQKMHETNLEYDLLDDVKEHLTNKIINIPRTIVDGDAIKWKTIHLGTLGKFIRDRTHAMLKLFLNALVWKDVADNPLTEVHKYHMEKLREALGIREKGVVADWIAQIVSTFPFNNTLTSNSDDYIFYRGGRVPVTDVDDEKASLKTLLGAIACSFVSCNCLEKLQDETLQYGLIQALDVYNNVTEHADFVVAQLFYNLFIDRDVAFKCFSPLTNSMLFTFYNTCTSSFSTNRLDTLISLKHFYKHIINSQKKWCMKQLNDISEEDTPRFFKPQMDLLIANLDSITIPVAVSEELSVTFRDFVDPESLRELAFKKEEEQLKKMSKVAENKPDEPARSEPIESIITQIQKETIGNVYDLGDRESLSFNERNQSYTLARGSRLLMRFDETNYAKHELMIKFIQDGHTLVFHTPLYEHSAKPHFSLELHNGMRLTFNEKLPFQEILFEGRLIRRTKSKPRQRNSSIARRGTLRSKSKSRPDEKIEILELPKVEEPIIPIDPDVLLYLEKHEKAAKEIWLKEFELKRRAFLKEMENGFENNKQPQISCKCTCAIDLLKDKITSYLDLPPDFEQECEVHKKNDLYRDPTIWKLISNPFETSWLNKKEIPVNKNNELDLQITWPTGLHISKIYYKQNAFYLKQEYLTPRKDLVRIPDELYRCHLTDGTVIKFNTNNKSVIYYPWGTIVMCTDVSWSDLLVNDDIFVNMFEEETEEEMRPSRSPESRKGSPRKPLESESRVQGEKSSVTIFERLPREIVFLNYSVLTSDGSFIEVESGVDTLIHTERMQVIDDLFCNTRTTKRSDGTLFLFDENGMMIVRFPDGTETRRECCFEEDEYFVQWTREELEMWFELIWDEEEQEAEEENDGETEGEDDEFEIEPLKNEDNKKLSLRMQNSIFFLEEAVGEGEEETPIKKINPAEDGFIVISILSNAVYHPNYASLASGCLEGNIINLYCPGDTVIHFSDNGLYTIVVGKEREVKFNVDSETISIETNKNDLLLQKSVLNFTAVKNANKDKILFVSKTDDFSDIKVLTNGDVEVRLPPNNTNLAPNPEAQVDKRFLFIHRDLSGSEIFSKKKLKAMVKHHQKTPGAKLDKYRESIVNHCVGVMPIDSINEYWSMKYPPIKTKNRYVIPSTYGATYWFPFQLEKSKVYHKPTNILLSVFKTMVFDNIEETFFKLIESYFNNIIDETQPANCNCSVNCLIDSIIGREDSSLCTYLVDKTNLPRPGFNKRFDIWLNKHLIPQICRMTSNKYNITRCMTNMKNDFHLIFEKSFPVYFDTAGGTAFVILHDILRNVDEIIIGTHLIDNKENLLNIPIDNMTEVMIKDLVLCIKPAEEGLGEIGQRQLKTILMSAKELKDYFPTMQDALNFRRRALNSDSECGDPISKDANMSKLVIPELVPKRDLKPSRFLDGVSMGIDRDYRSTLVKKTSRVSLPKLDFKQEPDIGSKEDVKHEFSGYSSSSWRPNTGRHSLRKSTVLLCPSIKEPSTANLSERDPTASAPFILPSRTSEAKFNREVSLAQNLFTQDAPLQNYTAFIESYVVDKLRDQGSKMSMVTFKINSSCSKITITDLSRAPSKKSTGSLYSSFNRCPWAVARAMKIFPDIQEEKLEGYFEKVNGNFKPIAEVLKYLIVKVKKLNN